MEKNNIPEIIDNLIIIPDTNILLYLYKCSFNSSQNIVELLNKVKDMVIVPSRVFKGYMAHKDERECFCYHSGTGCLLWYNIVNV